MDNTTANNQDLQKPDEMDMDHLLSLIKEQTKEIKLNKKKLEKLEEKYIKTNADLKNVLSDKMNIENFLRTIFPKDMCDNLIKTDYGLYDSAEMSKMYHVLESQKHNEFQQILNRQKNEISDLSEKVKQTTKEVEIKSKELNQLKLSTESNTDQLNFYMSNYNEINKKAELLENEKFFLVKMLDSKNEEIEKLTALEIENAELKAKSLLENLEKGNNSSSSSGFNNNLSKLMKNTNKSFSSYGNYGDAKNEYQLNEKNFKTLSLNVGCQTAEQFYSSDDVNKLDKQIIDLKQKLEKTKKEFNEYKEKSHKLLITNEENFNKMMKENDNLKREISQLLNEHINLNNNAMTTSSTSKNNKNYNMILQNNMLTTELNSKLRQDSLKSIRDVYNSQSDLPENKVNIEYMKNVLLKYLEAISMGNEFQSKLLENVIFTILRVPRVEREALEEKRARSSFYYNLWYNAKAFLSSRIYGSTPDTESTESSEITEANSAVEHKENNLNLKEGGKSEKIVENISLGNSEK